MLRTRYSLACWLSSPLLSIALCAQSPLGDETEPQGLTIVVVDVGQGSGMVLKTPDGTVHVIDAGEDGRGNTAMIPLIRSLGATSYGFTFLTHYHLDHSGGLDEVLNAVPALPFSLCYVGGAPLPAVPRTPRIAPLRAVAGAYRRSAK